VYDEIIDDLFLGRAFTLIKAIEQFYDDLHEK
jgi:hypothetical protein